MKIDQKDAINKLSPKWGNCPMCGKKDYEVGEHLLELRECEFGAINTNSFVFPVATVTCANCGQLSLVDAVQVGIKTIQE